MVPRYKSKDDEGGDDDEDGAAAAAVAAAELAPPSLCMVFKLPDEDECIDEEYMALKKEQRERIIGKLRNLNLNVEQVINRTKDKLIITISAHEEILKQHAEARGLKLALLEDKYGGGMCMYSKDLNDYQGGVFPDAVDGAGELPFTSLMQLEITDRIVRSTTFDTGGDAEALHPEELLRQPDDDELEPEIIGYFYMHFTRARVKLLVDWAGSWMKPQPLEQVRVYFGEKVALFFTFYGYFVTMLWLPALWGVWLFVTQCASRPDTQSWENPYMVVYAVSLSVWAVLFTQLWKRLEATRRYEWDTLDFEDQETELLEFRNHPETIKKKHANEITGQIDDYYFFEGTVLPPSGRKARSLASMIIILSLCFLSGCLSVWIYRMCQPLMKQGDTTFGACIIGLLYTVQTESLSHAFDFFLKWRMYVENWRTETEREDAIILRLAVFKLFNAYFGIFFIAFAANRIPHAPWLKCPAWQCMPVLQATFTSMMVYNLAYRLLKDKGMPGFLRWFKANNPFDKEQQLKKKANQTDIKLPMEEQLELEAPKEMAVYYEEIVIQFGYIAMFGSSFPLVGVISLLLNCIYLRTYAYDLLATKRRPPYQCASDIGTWQDVLQFLTLMSVVTNAGLCGLTGHSIYFYNPDLSYVDRLWCVAILEHGLLLVKIMV